MKVRLLALGILCLALLPLVAACGTSGGPNLAEARSDKERVTAPDVSEAQLTELAAGNTAFALDLYQAIRATDDNLFFSPHSISIALAMTYAGARGETEREMAEALHYTLPQEQLHAAFNALELELAKRAEVDGEGEFPRKPFQLEIANSVWGQQGFEFLAEFLDTLAEHYSAGLRLVDFKNDPEGARATINDLVSEQTEDRIPELLPPDVIDDLVRLVLTNTIFFNASWQFPFDEGESRNENFHLLDGTDIQVAMMHLEEESRYARVGDVQAVELFYDGGEVSFVAIVPDDGSFESFESEFDQETLSSVLGALERTTVELGMPKFEFKSDLDLKDALKTMGMVSAFEPKTADLSGMDAMTDLYISDVVHQAFVSVDEEGTEATAATGVVVSLTSAPAGPVELTIDRPFVFLIRDRSTDAVLFLGRVLDPSAE